MNVKKICGLLFLALCLMTSAALFAQAPSLQNIKNYSIDDLNDTQIKQIILKMEAEKISQADMEAAAIAQGMSRSELEKLKGRIAKVKRSAMSTANEGKVNQTGKGQYAPSSRSLTYSDEPKDTVVAGTVRDSVAALKLLLSELTPKLYGADIFRNANLAFEPNMRMATPKNYQVGPDDQLLIQVYGNSEVTFQLTVSPDGFINIPNVGLVSVGGITMDEATARIKGRMARVYTAINSGQTTVSVTLGNIRSIKVFITGQVVTPKAVTIPSVATVFGALYLSGGPTDNGSFRQIELVRAGKRIATIDLYDFIQNGYFKGGEIRLQDQDVIRVPVYNKRVEVVGEVKIPGLFELLPGEKFSDLLKYASGFNERAFQARIKVLRNTETQKKIETVPSDDFGTFVPLAGDKFVVSQILERFQNRVRIEGAVFRPGDFELTPGLTIKGLIDRAEGLREDAFKNLIYIIRVKDDLQAQFISVDMSRVIAGLDEDIALKREDLVQVSSVLGLKEHYTIQITGEVQHPDTYSYAEGMTVQDLIILSGGLKESATTENIEIARRVKNSDALSSSAKTADIIKLNITADLRPGAAPTKLEPFDIVSIRPSSGYTKQRVITVDGEVIAPGKYTLASKGERISDIIKRVHGFTSQAYAPGASLKRVVVVDTLQLSKYSTKSKSFDSKRTFDPTYRASRDEMMDDSLSREEESEILPNNFVGIDLPKIMRRPGGREDILLEDGDILYIPKLLQTVKVSGQVLSPSTVVYSRHRGFREYISNAGGFSSKALKKSAYIVYANGAVASTRRFLFFNNYPTVKPGGEIVVPVKEVHDKLSAAELVAVTSGVASLGAIVLGILNLSK